MRHRRFPAIAAAVLMTGGVAACGSDEVPAPPLQDGAMQPGVARIVINDDDAGTVDTVHCTRDSAGTLSITIGDENQGATAVVAQAEDFLVRTVTFTDIGGFSGSYLYGVGEGSAEATTIGTTYSITGTARGFDADSPSYASEATFDIAAACA